MDTNKPLHRCDFLAEKLLNFLTRLSWIKEVNRDPRAVDAIKFVKTLAEVVDPTTGLRPYYGEITKFIRDKIMPAFEFVEEGEIEIEGEKQPKMVYQLRPPDEKVKDWKAWLIKGNCEHFGLNQEKLLAVDLTKIKRLSQFKDMEHFLLGYLIVLLEIAFPFDYAKPEPSTKKIKIEAQQ